MGSDQQLGADRRIVKVSASGLTAWCRTDVLADTGPDQVSSVLTAVLSAPHMQVLKIGRRSRVVTCHAARRTCVVKHYHSNWLKHLACSWLKRTVGWREWNSALRLKALDVRVVVPWALVSGPVGQERLILEHVSGKTYDQFVADQGAPVTWTAEQRQQRFALAQQIGTHIGALAAAGVYNRDCKPSNFILDDATWQGQPPMVIDAALRPLRSDRQVIMCLAILLRSVNRVGQSTRSEYHACLHGLARTYPAIFSRRSKRWIIREVATILRSFYRCHDSITFQKR